VARWWCAAHFVTISVHRSHSASSAVRRLGERT
jgi:hypothetical protein